MKIQKLVVLAVVFVGLAYHNSLFGPFVFDDVDSICENRTIRHLWPPWQALSPSHGSGSTVEGRPVVNFTLAINYALGGVTPWGYHALNLAIHILAGLTLFGIVRRTLLRPVMSGRFGAEATPLALAIALIWTVHPLVTEAVTYVTQRAESLMGLFYLLTMYCFIRGVESRQPGRWYVLSVTACLLGMGTKEVMVSAPLLVLLYDRTFITGSFPQAWRQRWQLYVGLASTWIVLGYLVATTGSHGGTAGFESGLVWWQYALMQCRVIIHYLKLSVWPHPLVFDYGMPTVSHMSEILPDALVLAALATGTAIALWRRPAVGFLGVWFFAILAPSSSVIPLPTEMIAEHRMYLPLVAVVVLGVMGIHNLVGRQTVAVVVVLAIALGVLTWRRNQDYRSDIAIWDDTVAKCPNNPRARNNLGLALVQVGRPAEAIVQYEQALRVKPDFAQAHYGLGVALARVGRLPEAIVQYEQALRIRPDYAEPHFYLGIALVQLGKTQEATEHYEQALRLKPDYLEAHYNLGVALIRLGKPQEAIRHWEQAVRINPDFAEAHYDLGHASEELGRTTEAIEHYEQALRLRPNLTPARDALARLQGRP